LSSDDLVLVIPTTEGRRDLNEGASSSARSLLALLVRDDFTLSSRGPGACHPDDLVLVIPTTEGRRDLNKGASSSARSLLALLVQDDFTLSSRRSDTCHPDDRQ